MKDKRAELTARIEDLAAELEEAQTTITALDKVIAIYDPEWQPESSRRRRKNASKGKLATELNAVLGKTNRRQAVLDILRVAGPTTCAECTQAFAERFGIPSGNPKYRLMNEIVSKNLSSLEAHGWVRSTQPEDGLRKIWEIAV
ncbi:hypothetical protein Q669_21480 [Labrenzia sp. C1B10]|nr:hypothetical protein Q669_21480 [Labrenzia sp. C1B10]ERS01572.1 hypothetical protein Q675_05595 [Labrenzia sp. C1B70]